MRKGDTVSVYYEGKVITDADKYLHVGDPSGKTHIYSKSSGVVIKVVRPAFDPQPGQLYRVKPASSDVVPGVWMVIKDRGVTKMASGSGIYSLELFTASYMDNKNWEVTRVVL